MRLNRFICLVATFSVMLLSCSRVDTDSDNPGIFGKFNTKNETLKVGSTYQLPYVVSVNLSPYQDYDFDADRYNVSVVSSDPSVVKVIGKGCVEALSSGSAIIKATLGGYTSSMTIRVIEDNHDPDKPVNADSLLVANTNWNWQVSANFVQAGYATFDLFGKRASISVARYPMDKLSTSIVYYTGNDCKTTSAAGIAAGAAVAINGSFFNTTTLVANTFYASNGTVICSKALDTRSNGIVGIHKGGHDIDIIKASTSLFQTYALTYGDVIAAGPMLLQDGEICENNKELDFNKTSHPRSIIGKDKQSRIWMIVIDGRFAGQGDGASIEECSLICRYLGLTDAINLDGGGSSCLWTPVTGVINHPCDNKKWDHAGERKDPTNIVAR